MKWLAEKLLKLFGWQFVGDVPDAPRYIVVGAPHTSNWDFVIFLGAISHWEMRPKFLGKHTLFQGPFGWLFRKWGGIPVDRSKGSGLISAVAREFESSQEFALVIAPEGTRKAAPMWKSGFAKIAEASGAPVVPARVDFGAKQVTLGDPILYTGNADGLMTTLRSFFAGSRGRRPEGEGPVRIREETSRGS